VQPRLLKTGQSYTLPALLLVVAVFLTLLYFAYDTSNKRQVIARAQSTSQWMAVQANHEAQRFSIAAEQFFSGDEDVDRDLLLLRFEILLSRLPLFYAGPEAHDLMKLEGLKSKILAAERQIRALEPVVQSAARGDIAALSEVRTTMAAASSRLSEVVFDAVQTLPGNMRLSYWNNLLLVLYLSVALSVVGLIVLVGLIYAQNVRAERVKDQYHQALMDADAANRSKSRLLANVSHELRTPLNAIIGFSDVLKDQLFGDLGNDRYREYANYINESGDHLLHLVNDLLDFAKYEADQVSLTIEPMPLNELVVDALRMTSGDANAMGIKLVLDQGLHFDVLADQRAVRQIMTNLIGNAVKYAPRNSAVEIRCAPEGTARVRVEILDRGPGIPESEVTRLLRPFERLHQDSFVANDDAGAGLGLALAQSLAKKHGGDINLLQRDGGGTVASFTLPLSLGSMDSPDAAPSDAGHPPTSSTQPDERTTG